MEESASHLVEILVIQFFHSNSRFYNLFYYTNLVFSIDPYHTYLSLAALSMYPPESDGDSESWVFEPLDPLLNARETTASWIRMHCPAKK
jgi:hypothetical protein